ncbi:hypothetical protein HP550_06865 [Cellulomonas humilata]|uniref:Acetyltransferase n=1 Tax=Cellulomonas humilata TaxID=144055 RepID=A0A7Y6A1W4_9CELL|nr:hypothetical protein [Cellulomonas humilata]NUU16969.1 hypothetical protein [Cellulomonas humilata]
MRISLAALLPASQAKNWILRKLGHDVAPSAHISPIFVVGRTRLIVGSDARIGALNAFRNVVSVKLGDGAELGQLNWVSAAPFLLDASGSASAGHLELGEHASLTNRHYVDVSGGVRLERFAIVAGVRSVLMTHGIDVADGVLDTAPIVVGEYAMVGGCVNMVLGSTVPPRSVVAMGAVVVRGLTEEGHLYAGVPAVSKRRVDMGQFGSRKTGKIMPRDA